MIQGLPSAGFRRQHAGVNAGATVELILPRGRLYIEFGAEIRNVRR